MAKIGRLIKISTRSSPFYFVAFNCSFESNLALTFTPFLTLVKPSTMIVSPGAKPALIIVSLPLVPPTSTYFLFYYTISIYNIDKVFIHDFEEWHD